MIREGLLSLVSVVFINNAAFNHIFMYFEELMEMSRRESDLYMKMQRADKEKKKKRMIFNNDCRRETISF